MKPDAATSEPIVANQPEHAASSDDLERMRRSPLLDLIHGNSDDQTQIVLTKATITQPEPPIAAPLPAPRRRPFVMVTLGALAVILIGSVAAYLVLPHKAPMATTPQATIAPKVSPTPQSSPAPSPSPTSQQAAVPKTVSAPLAAPTVEHPQAVTVQSPNGIWFRSRPSSADQSNVIGWIPKGATVSVDGTGDFWWHGTYQGKSGYFASSYTK